MIFKPLQKRNFSSRLKSNFRRNPVLMKFKAILRRVKRVSRIRDKVRRLV